MPLAMRRKRKRPKELTMAEQSAQDELSSRETTYKKGGNIYIKSAILNFPTIKGKKTQRTRDSQHESKQTPLHINVSLPCTHANIHTYTRPHNHTHAHLPTHSLKAHSLTHTHTHTHSQGCCDAHRCRQRRPTSSRRPSCR